MTPPTLPPHMARSGRPAPAQRRRPGGIALLMSLAVVMLLTFFMSEYFFATGLELRGMTTYKDAQQARMLARSAFKAVQVGLLQDEVLFFQGYSQLSQLLQVASVPWNDGLLLTLEIAPQDALYNLNQNYNLRQGEPYDTARRGLFVNTLADVQVKPDGEGAVEEPVSTDVLLGLYGALFDWIDSDEEDYVAVPGLAGGEERVYFGTDPPVQVKNGMLDRLEEIRVVHGVLASHIPWRIWEQRFTALPRVTDSNFYFTQKININLASAEQIQRFLEDRVADPNVIGTNKDIQEAINGFADRAQEIGEFFAPKDVPRKIYEPNELQAALRDDLGFQDNFKYGDYVFKTADEYYRIRIVTEVADVRASLEAMVHIPRDAKTRMGTNLEVLWVRAS